MADDTTPDLAKTHDRPDQAEAPVDDIGASDVDLDEARHGGDHVSPAVPEPAHAPDHHGDHDHGHDDHGHDDHGDHPVEDPKWVLLPMLLGAALGIIVIILVGGLASGADPFHAL